MEVEKRGAVRTIPHSIGKVLNSKSQEIIESVNIDFLVSNRAKGSVSLLHWCFGYHSGI